jgi:hypothetical protein
LQVLAFTTTQWAQIAAPGLTAVAACASWAAVIQSRKAFKASLTPRLDGHAAPDHDGGIVLEVHNTGAGFARAPYLIVARGDRKVVERVADGPLRPGKSARFHTQLPVEAESRAITGVMFCLDAADRWHVWSWDGRHRRLRRWPWQAQPRLDPAKALRLMYPQAEPAGLTKTPGGRERDPAASLYA